jgi:hypothetical protein
MDSNAFTKKFGFDRPPRAFFSGTFQSFKNAVEATLTCKTCGGTVHMHFRGNPDTMSEQGLREWILKRAEARHQCPAITDILAAKSRRYFADLFRGKEKLQEEQYKASQHGMTEDFRLKRNLKGGRA